MTIRICRCFSLVLALAVLSTGCAEQDEIRRYKVEKNPATSSPTKTASGPKDGEPARMLAAIAFEGDISWFFKLTGAPELVDGATDGFQSLLKSIEFEDGQPYSKPKWTLPEGWTAEMSKGGIRFATITVPTDDEPLELSVIPLPTGEDRRQWLLSNINRWRGQLSLDDLQSDALESETQQVAYSGGEATFVDIKGTQKGGGMSRGMGGAPFAPFANGGGRTTPPVEKPAATAEDRETPSLR